MPWIEYNSNPNNRRVGDCTIRAISAATGLSWEAVYAGVAIMGFVLRDMPSADHVWGQYLRRQGFQRSAVPCAEEPCTVAQFCRDHPSGVYLLAMNSHVVCVIDGNYYDTWDCGGEYPVYFWVKER